LKEKYYNQGLEYFCNFEGFDSREILKVEGEYLFKVGKYNFTGKIDLECPDEIIDHKTKGKLHLKRLTKKHNKEEYIQMLCGRHIHKDNFRQLYIYSIPFKEKYGKYPKLLNLNMIRINDWYSIEFNKKDFQESIDWLVGNIDKIYKDNEFKKGDDVGEFWCSNICSQRLNCVYSDRYLGV